MNLNLLAQNTPRLRFKHAVKAFTLSQACSAEFPHKRYCANNRGQLDLFRRSDRVLLRSTYNDIPIYAIIVKYPLMIRFT